MLKRLLPAWLVIMMGLWCVPMPTLPVPHSPIPQIMQQIVVNSAGNPITADTMHCVQDNGTTASATAACTLSSVTAGDAIVCGWQLNRYYGNNQFVSIGDSVNGKYNVIGTNYNPGAGTILGMAYFLNVAAGSYTPTLASTDASATHAAISCETFQNLLTSAALDGAQVTQEQTGTAQNPTAGSASTPTNGGELLYAFLNTTLFVGTAGTNYTAVDSQTNSRGYPEYWIQTTGTPTNAPYSTAGTDTGWVDEVMALLPSNAPAGSKFLSPMFNNSEDGSANGTAVTTSILTNGTHCGLGTWGAETGGSPLGGITVSTTEAPGMISPVHTDCGVIYPDTSPTRSYQVGFPNSAGDFFTYSWYSYPGSVLPTKASVGFWYSPTMATSDIGYFSINLMGNAAGGNDFESVMLHSGKIYIEATSSPNGPPVTCTGCTGGQGYSFTSNALYWITTQYVQYVNSSSVHSLDIFTVGGSGGPCPGMTLASSQTKYAAAGNGPPGTFNLGEVGDVTEAGAYIYVRGIIVDNVNGHFPICPGQN